MTPELFNKIAITPAMSLLPEGMDSPAARAMILAICLQESRLIYRRQIGGPARSFAQFELGGGIKGVLSHPSSRPHVEKVLDTLGYNHDPETSYVAIEHNDILCVVFSRLLLYTLPSALPGEGDSAEGWRQYLKTWRPGKPHVDTWQQFYAQAWETVRDA